MVPLSFAEWPTRNGRRSKVVESADGCDGRIGSFREPLWAGVGIPRLGPMSADGNLSSADHVVCEKSAISNVNDSRFSHEAEFRALIQDIPDIPSSELSSLTTVSGERPKDSGSTGTDRHIDPDRPMG